MDDLIARMRCRTLMQYRGHGDARDVPDEDCNEAADELERLRSEIARLREALEASKKRFEVLRSAYDRLRNKPIEIYGSAALAEKEEK